VDSRDALDRARFGNGVCLDGGIRHFAGEGHDAVGDIDVDVDDVRKTDGRQPRLHRRVNLIVADLRESRLGRGTGGHCDRDR
jgi:hypothetical protein